jgi:hypothetical protein
MEFTFAASAGAGSATARQQLLQVVHVAALGLEVGQWQRRVKWGTRGHSKMAMVAHPTGCHF